MKVQIKDFYSPHNSSSNFFATKSLKHKESTKKIQKNNTFVNFDLLNLSAIF